LRPFVLVTYVNLGRDGGEIEDGLDVFSRECQTGNDAKINVALLRPASFPAVPSSTPPSVCVTIFSERMVYPR